MDKPSGRIRNKHVSAWYLKPLPSHRSRSGHSLISRMHSKSRAFIALFPLHSSHYSHCIRRINATTAERTKHEQVSHLLNYIQIQGSDLYMKKAGLPIPDCELYKKRGRTSCHHLPVILYKKRGRTRVRHGSVGSMSARCKAGLSSNPDSAPQGGVCH